MDVRSKTSADLGALCNHRLLVAKIRLRIVSEAKMNITTVKRSQCYFMDKLKDANILSSFRSKIAQHAVVISNAQTPSTDQKWAKINKISIP